MAGKETAAARPKQRASVAGRSVPSRYMSYDKGSKKGSRKAAATEATVAEPHEVSAIKKPHEVLQSTLETHGRTRSELEVSVVRKPLQSTPESHGRNRPELDISAVRNKSCSKSAPSKQHQKATRQEKPNLVPSDSADSDQKRMLGSETMLLIHASLKVQKNIALLEKSAERDLLTLSKEAARLQAENRQKRHRLQRLRKNFQVSKAMDKQLEALGPIGEQLPAFVEQYRHFATSLDTVRHELPVNEIYLGEDKGQYLGDLQGALAVTQESLRRALPEQAKENAKGLSIAKELEGTSLEVEAELQSAFADLVKMSADVSKEASLRSQKVHEDEAGVDLMKQLYFD